MSDAEPVCVLVSALARILLDEEAARRIAEAGEGAEVERFYARSYGRSDRGELVEAVVASLEASSLFAPQRLVVVFDGGGLIREKAVQAWIGAPGSRTRLLLLHRLETSRDKPPKPRKGLAVHGVPLAGPGTPAARHKWLDGRARAVSCSLSKEALSALEEMVGEGLDALVREVDKLCLYRLEGEITRQDVEDLVGRSAGRDFDHLYSALLGGRLGSALGHVKAMEEEGFVTFGGGRIYGANAVSGALLPILLSRLRRTGTVGASGKQQAALIESLKVNPWFAKRLGQEAQRLGPRRMAVWLDAALKAEVAWKRTSHLRDADLLELLFVELARA